MEHPYDRYLTGSTLAHKRTTYQPNLNDFVFESSVTQLMCSSTSITAEIHTNFERSTSEHTDYGDIVTYKPSVDAINSASLTSTDTLCECINTKSDFIDNCTCTDEKYKVPDSYGYLSSPSQGLWMFLCFLFVTIPVLIFTKYISRARK